MEQIKDAILAFGIGCREAYTDIIAEQGPWVYSGADSWLQPIYNKGAALGEALRLQSVRLGIIRYYA